MLNPEFLDRRRLSSRIAAIPALGALADVVQPTIRRARDANPLAKSALAGTWLGHSLHPMLTDVPIGAFTVLAALDVAELFGAQDMRRAGEITLGVAIVGAYASIVTGWADWADTSEQPKKVGIAHALLNGSGMLAYQASLAMRRTGRRRPAIAAAFVGYAFVALGSYLGGELTTAMQIGIRHTATVIPPPDDFVDVAAMADVPEDGWLRVDANGTPVLIARDGDGFSAVGAVCSHRGAPLDEGTREGDCVRCPWHGARFSLRDGAVLEGPAVFALPTYVVRAIDGRIGVRADAKRRG